MGTIAQEAAFQIALENGRGECQYVCDFGEGGIYFFFFFWFGFTCNQAHILQKVAASSVKVTVGHRQQMSP